jgi:hypothetical protein
MIFLGAAATMAWQSYNQPARETIAKLYPQLSWLAPQAATAPDRIEQISRNVERIASDVAVSKEQMAREIMRLQALPQYTSDKNQEAPPVPTVGDHSLQSLLSYFTAAFSQPPSPPPHQMEVLQTQPNAVPDRSGEATQTISPKPARPNKAVRRGRPQFAPPPTTTGAAVRSDRPEQSTSNEKQDLPLNEADGEALFQNFVKWQLDRNLFGRP